MDIVPDKLKTVSTNKPEVEQVVKEKQEWKLIGKYLRTKGLALYAYNSLRNKLIQVDVKSKGSILLTYDEDDKLIPVDQAHEEATVDSRNIHFEALNWKSAQRRVKRYKEGKIKELCNLREPNPDNKIKIY